MPFAVLKSIVQVSSEDQSHSASNLLKNDHSKKWKTSTNGEKSAYVIIQLENEMKITGVDIGNEHSAFVEVLVGRTKKPDEFKELILTSSLMTPIESKNSSNANRVRCFDKDRLVESVSNEKWNLVKLFCTQPFNKHCQYGLSFIKIHVDTEIKDQNQNLVPEKFLVKPNKEVSTFGSFKLREESPDSENESPTGLFNRWKQQTGKSPNISDKKPKSSAVAIHEASTPKSLKMNADDFKPTKIFQKQQKAIDVETKNYPILNRNRDDLFFNESDNKPNQKLEQKIQSDQERVAKQNENKIKVNSTKKQLSGDKSSTEVKKIEEKMVEKKVPKNPQNDSPRNQNKKRPSATMESETPVKKLKSERTLLYKPFNKLFDGVIFTISGIQNPERAALRSKALALGAKYKPDWDKNCSHLICAFKNTPKYLQVQQENGKIVKKTWIEECYTQKKRLSWRKFALDKLEANKDESEEEILDISLKRLSAAGSSSHKSNDKTKKESNQQVNDDTLAQYDLEPDREVNRTIASGSDTEEEIEKIRDKKSTNIREDSDDNAIYEQTTEEDECMKKLQKTKLDEPKTFFNNLIFYLNPSLPNVEKIKLNGIIENYNGTITDSIQQSKFVITKEFIKTPINYQGQVISPLWIYECNDMECMIPINRYLITDSS